MTDYRQMDVVPAHICYLAKQDTPTAEIPTDIKWSNLTMDVPPIGAIVHVRFNGIKAARVERYFVEHGFLGLLVKPLAPPEWFVKQNGRGSTCHVFGTEVDPMTDDPAKRAVVRIIRHRDLAGTSIYRKRRIGDRFTARVFDARGQMMLDGCEVRTTVEGALKLAEKFCAKNKLNLFSVSVEA